MTQPFSSTTALASTAGTFSAGHIALTAAITGVLVLTTAMWRLPRGSWPDVVAVGVLATAAVFLWRISANMPQLNDDGLPHFSANDWLAPALTYLFLSVYADLRPPADPRRYNHTRALAVLIALLVNVVTI